MATFNVNIGQSTGTTVIGNGNVVHVGLPSLGTLNLTPEQTARIEAALAALASGRADEDADARALKEAAADPDARSRGERIKDWLVKIAPSLLGAAGSLLNPVVGEIAKAAGAWVGRSLGNDG